MGGGESSRLLPDLESQSELADPLKKGLNPSKQVERSESCVDSGKKIKWLVLKKIKGDTPLTPFFCIEEGRHGWCESFLF